MSERSDSRPLSPRLSIYRWSPGMLASIAHRASGVVLVLFVPLYLWLLHGMTGSADSFSAVFDWLHSAIGRFSLWLAGSALIYHFCNGIRFLLVDIGVAESRRALRISAAVVITLAALASLLLAVLL